MYVINTQTHIVNIWADSEINRQRLASGKYGVKKYTGEIETVNGMMYEKGFAPVSSFEEAKAEKQTELATAFDRATQTAHCQTSAGFEINADETANRNIEGLTLVLKPGESTLFRAWDNRFHQVTKEQLETMRREIVVHSQKLYQTKWEIEAAIDKAQTVEELEAIDIAFEKAGQEEGEGYGQTM